MRTPVWRSSIYGAIVIALTSLVLMGATPAVPQRTAPRQTVRHAAPRDSYQTGRRGPVRPAETIVAVGDSITKGDWDTAVEGGWVARLAAKLRGAYPTAAVDVRDAGVDGDTTAGVLERLARDVLAAHPRLVIVSIGTNDFDSGVAAPVFKARLATLVHRVRTSPGTPAVVLASMLPIAGQTPGRLAAERAYNDIIRQDARAANVGYLDLFDPWLALGPSYLHLLRHDTEHPNPIGYELLASTTAAFLEAGYFDARGRVVAPVQAPTCAIVCDTTPTRHG